VFRVRNGLITEVIEYLDTVLVETAAYGRKLV
jgi:ketosteroid isomerase-like protein